jgi:hypothetical protein
MDCKKTFFIALMLSLLIGQKTAAQKCSMQNTAFKAGEKITYDLYYKYGLINAKAGTGFIETSQISYRGQNVYKIYMQANTSGMVGSLYTVNDTLTGYVDMNMIPLLFTKEAFEGDEYTKERQVYSYGDDGSVNIRAIRNRNGKALFDEVVATDECTYDYISILSYARNLDYSSMKTGQNIPVHFVSGRKIVNMYIRYLGVSKMKANDGKSYDVIQLSMMILNKSFTNQKEAMRVAITNDSNRLPVVIDTSLKVGSIKVVLKSYSNIKYPIN